MLEVPPTPGRRGVIGVVIRDERLLLIRRSDRVVAPLMYCFPGGGIHPGESEPKALIREFREELNVEVKPLCRIWQSVTPWEVQLSWWSAEMADDTRPIANPAEVASVHWFTLAEMAELPASDSLPSNLEFLEALQRGEIDLAIRP